MANAPELAALLRGIHDQQREALPLQRDHVAPCRAAPARPCG